MASGSGPARPEHSQRALALPFLGLQMETLVYKILKFVKGMPNVFTSSLTPLLNNQFGCIACKTIASQFGL